MANNIEQVEGFEFETIDPHVFPIGPEVIRSLFESESVPVKENDQGLYEWMRDTNPHAFAYLENFDQLLDDGNLHEDTRERISNEITDSMLYGQLLFYASFRERSAKLPVTILREEFVDRYSDEKNFWLGVSHVNNLGDQDQAILVHLFNMASFFKMAERDTYDALEDEVRNSDADKKYSSDFVIAGFAQAYFLFKEGLSDMENYETEHMLIH